MARTPLVKLEVIHNLGVCSDQTEVGTQLESVDLCGLIVQG